MWFELIKIDQIGDVIPDMIWQKQNLVTKKSHNMIMNAGVKGKYSHGMMFYTKEVSGVTLKVGIDLDYLNNRKYVGLITLLHKNQVLEVCVVCDPNTTKHGTSGDNIYSLFMIGDQLRIIDIGIKLIKNYIVGPHQKLEMGERFHGGGIFSIRGARDFLNRNKELLDEKWVQHERHDDLPEFVVKQFLGEL
jgi:hypothetical protein